MTVHPTRSPGSLDLMGRAHFTADDLAETAGIKRISAQGYLHDWEKAGLVRRVGSAGPTGQLGVFQKTSPRRKTGAEGDDETPRGKATPSINMWRTIRMLGEFSATDVAAHSTAGSVDVPLETARAYCQLLARAGYLRCTVKAKPPAREARYRLIRDTGPKPPRERRIRVVWDDNLGEITHQPGPVA